MQKIDELGQAQGVVDLPKFRAFRLAPETELNL